MEILISQNGYFLGGSDRTESIRQPPGIFLSAQDGSENISFRNSTHIKSLTLSSDAIFSCQTQLTKNILNLVECKSVIDVRNMRRISAAYSLKRRKCWECGVHVPSTRGMRIAYSRCKNDPEYLHAPGWNGRRDCHRRKTADKACTQILSF